jgi:hypothetical protein
MSVFFARHWHKLCAQGDKKSRMERMMEYLLLVAAAAIVALIVFLRKQKSYADESFDPTEAMETWGGPGSHFADTVLVDALQTDFKSTSPGVR